MAIVRTGAVTRPQGASSTGPQPGTRVQWKLTQPIADLCEQGSRHGFANLGTVGDTGHLRKHGDHTPWSKGKLPGWIYGKDTDMPSPGFRKWLVEQCRRADYDTSWIDFFNVDGRQYDNSGDPVATSGDYHFHLSVRKGYENTHVTLFDDFVADITGTAKKSKGDDMPTMDELLKQLVPAVADAVWKQSLSSPSLDKGGKHGAHEGVINAIDTSRRLRRVEETLNAVAAKVGVPGDQP